MHQRALPHCFDQFVDVLVRVIPSLHVWCSCEVQCRFFPQPLQVSFLFLFSIYRLMNTGLRIRDASPLQSGAHFPFEMPRHSIYCFVVVIFCYKWCSCSTIHTYILLKDHGKVKS
jgi:hypothetical protein